VNKRGPSPLSGQEASAVEPATPMTCRLRARGFRAYLDSQGVLLIADATGRRRDVTRYLPIDEVFDELVAGLADDPELLDS
jgi:hypothetical protein